MRPARLYASYVNVKRVDLKLYRLTPEDLLQRNRATGTTNAPPASALVRQWSQTLEASLNKVSYAAIDAQEGGEPLAPGVYLLIASSPSLKENATACAT